MFNRFMSRTDSYFGRLNWWNTLEKFRRTIHLINFTAWLFERSYHFFWFINNWGHWTNMKWFYLPKNFVLLTFPQKNYRFCFDLSLILNKNDWNFKFIFHPFGNSCCKGKLMFWIIKRFIEALHYNLIKKWLCIYFFNERRFQILFFRLKLIDNESKVW